MSDTIYAFRDFEERIYGSNYKEEPLCPKWLGAQFEGMSYTAFCTRTEGHEGPCDFDPRDERTLSMYGNAALKEWLDRRDSPPSPPASTLPV